MVAGQGGGGEREKEERGKECHILSQKVFTEFKSYYNTSVI